MTTPPSSSRRLTPQKAVMFGAIGSVLLTATLVTALEFVASFFVEPMVAREIPGDSVSRTVTYIEVNPAPLELDVDLLWRNVPNARKTQLVNPQAFGRNDEWSIENNSRGLRGPELEPRTDDVFRILCVGDSITFGFSVDQPDTYPRQLAAALAKRHPDQRFEVINAGVPGWSWLQGLEYLDLRGMDLDPDLVIIGHGTNDQLFPSKLTDEERFLRLASPVSRVTQKIATFAAQTNLYRALARGKQGTAADELSPGCREQMRKYNDPLCRRVAIDEIASAVHEVARLAAARGVDLLVANTDFVQTSAVKGVRQGVEIDHVPFLDLVGELNVRRKSDEQARATKLGLAQESQVAAPAAPGRRTVVLRTLVPDPYASYRVEGVGYFHPGLTFSEPLYDDGTHGDERAADGVFSVALDLSAEFPALEYKYYQGDEAEFRAIPPLNSALGDRVLISSSVGPVDVFGQSLFMVERCHPNREGHGMIAELIAGRIEELPSFLKFAKGTRTP